MSQSFGDDNFRVSTTFYTIILQFSNFIGGYFLPSFLYGLAERPEKSSLMELFKVRFEDILSLKLVKEGYYTKPLTAMLCSAPY